MPATFTTSDATPATCTTKRSTPSANRLFGIRDVRAAGFAVIGLDLDLVDTAEIADRIGRSKQAVCQYADGRRGPGDSRYLWELLAACGYGTGAV